MLEIEQNKDRTKPSVLMNMFVCNCFACLCVFIELTMRKILIRQILREILKVKLPFWVNSSFDLRPLTHVNSALSAFQLIVLSPNCNLCSFKWI